MLPTNNDVMHSPRATFRARDAIDAALGDFQHTLGAPEVLDISTTVAAHLDALRAQVRMKQITIDLKEDKLI